MEIKQIKRDDALPFILDIHYAKRAPSISMVFGLYIDGVLEGICSFGSPPSSTLRTGICGPEFGSTVLELNRLCLRNNHRNHASYLIAGALRQIEGNHIVVSFADPSYGHVGTVYQATNFLYCGLSAKRTNWCIRGKEHLHSLTIADEFRGVPNRAKAIREKYGDDFYLADRPRKHRYVYFIGDRKFKKKAKIALRYGIKPYPKMS